jgi:hypothetical protein
MKKKDKRRMREMRGRIAYFGDALLALQNKVGLLEGRTEGLNCPASPRHEVCPLGKQSGKTA